MSLILSLAHSAVIHQGEGLTLISLKIMQEHYSVQENNHHDSLAGKGQNGNDCSLIMELLRQLFTVTWL